MKIVISSKGTTLKADVDPRFGRAAFLIIYDTDKKEVVEVIDNFEGQDAAQGAGISVAGLMAQKGVEVILTGRVGPKAMAVVDKAGMKVVSEAKGTVTEAIEDFLGSRIEPASATGGRVEGAIAGTGCRNKKTGRGTGGGSGQRKCRGGRGMGRSPGK